MGVVGVVGVVGVSGVVGSVVVVVVVVVFVWDDVVLGVYTIGGVVSVFADVSGVLMVSFV
ncbi:MAG TPA: hypothetical protein DCY49_03795 [Candidatus Jacksonbacteria bacterium]|nr:hypothetical protein [Candidatus Jacksonbacteria bacterium]